MPIPGVDINVGLPSVVASETIADESRYLAVGLADRGPTNAAVTVRSLAQFESIYGQRTTYGWLWDAANVYFQESGGGEMVVARVVGPAAVKASASVASTVKFEAANAGAWANGWTVVVSAGTMSGKKVTVRDAAGLLVESQDNLADTDAVVAASWGTIVPTKLGSTALANGTSTLASGADDRASVTGTELAAALALFTDEIVGGVVDVPGYACSTSAGSGTIGSTLSAHAGTFNRMAYLGMAAGATSTDAATAWAAQSTAAGPHAPFALLFHPWVKAPIGSVVRNVPATAFVAGRRVRAHQRYGANRSVAGAVAAADYVTGVETAYTATDVETMYAAGVNGIRMINGKPTCYGYRTLSLEPRWKLGNVADLRNSVIATARQIGLRFVHEVIDGKGRTVTSFRNALRGALMAYADAGQFFPLGKDPGYFVDTSAAVNTPSTLANNELRARIGFRPSATAEHVIIDINTAQVNGAL